MHSYLSIVDIFVLSIGFHPTEFWFFAHVHMIPRKARSIVDSDVKFILHSGKISLLLPLLSSSGNGAKWKGKKHILFLIDQLTSSSAYFCLYYDSNSWKIHHFELIFPCVSNIFSEKSFSKREPNSRIYLS